MIKSCFSEEWILENAKETGFIRRNRKIDVVVFFWTLILSFGTGVSRSLSDLRRVYEQTAGIRLVASSFYERFSVRLALFLKRAVKLACETMSEPVECLSDKLSDFKDLLVTDATVIKLHDFLEKRFPACRTNHTKASLKLHVVMSVLSVSPRTIRITSGRKHESKVIRVGPWMKDRLLLMDLGYYDFSLFERIERNGGYFISRLKDNANPLITKDYGNCRGRSIDVTGKKLQDVLPKLKRKFFDVEVELKVNRRKYGDNRNVVTKRFRAVGVYNDKTSAYHIYVTNVPADSLTAEDVALTYRCRWEVELLFKELKNHYRIDQIPSSKEAVVEVLIYAAILTLILSRSILFALRKSAGIRASRSPERRWAATFQSAAVNILNLVIGSFGIKKLDNKNVENKNSWNRLEIFLTREMIDPNVNRTRNLAIARY